MVLLTPRMSISSALAEEPLAHADLGAVKGDGEAEAVFHGEKRHEPAVGVLAFEHEVDAEDEGGEQIEDAGPSSGGRRRRDIRRWRRAASSAFCGDGVDAELVGVGEVLEAGDDGGDAGGQVGGELVEIADDGRQAEGEEEGDGEEGEAEQKRDGEAAREMWRPPRSLKLMMLLTTGIRTTAKSALT